jgi:hypothetical protein
VCLLLKIAPFPKNGTPLRHTLWRASFAIPEVESRPQDNDGFPPASAKPAHTLRSIPNLPVKQRLFIFLPNQFVAFVRYGHLQDFEPLILH